MLVKGLHDLFVLPPRTLHADDFPPQMDDSCTTGSKCLREQGLRRLEKQWGSPRESTRGPKKLACIVVLMSGA